MGKIEEEKKGIFEEIMLENLSKLTKAQNPQIQKHNEFNLNK